MHMSNATNVAEAAVPSPNAHRIYEQLLFYLQCAVDKARTAQAHGSIDLCPVLPEGADEAAWRLASLPLEVIADLCAVAVLCNLPGPWSRAMTGVCEQLKRRRAEKSLPPVRIGTRAGTSTADALWKAGEEVTRVFQFNFGGNWLVEIVQNVFPQDLEADPHGMGAVLFEYLRSTEDALDASWRQLEAIGRQPSHLTCLAMRFRGHGLREAVLAVEVTALCEWLSNALPGFDPDWLRRELDLEFAEDDRDLPKRVQPSETTPTPPADIESKNRITATDANPATDNGKVPPEERTRPMNLQEAAKLMGYARMRNSKKAVDTLREAMDNRIIPFERINRQCYIFNRQNVPKEVWSKLTPTDPN
jgi:hypothetical protein